VLQTGGGHANTSRHQQHHVIPRHPALDYVSVLAPVAAGAPGRCDGFSFFAGGIPVLPLVSACRRRHLRIFTHFGPDIHTISRVLLVVWRLLVQRAHKLLPFPFGRAARMTRGPCASCVLVRSFSCVGVSDGDLICVGGWRCLVQTRPQDRRNVGPQVRGDSPQIVRGMLIRFMHVLPRPCLHGAREHLRLGPHQGWARLRRALLLCLQNRRAPRVELWGLPGAVASSKIFQVLVR